MWATAALLVLYAYPAIARRLWAPTLDVAMTWLLCSTFPFLFPASKRLRNAMTAKKTAEVFTAYVWLNFSKLVFQKCSRSSETDGFCFKPSTPGPEIPEFAMRTLIYPSEAVMVSTIRERSAFFVTSPWSGMIFPFFWIPSKYFRTSGRRRYSDLQLVWQLSQGLPPSAQ